MNFFKTLFLFALMLSLGGCHMFQSSSEYYGLNISSKKNVFIIDISGSMEGKVEKDASGKILASATQKAADIVGDQIGGVAGSIFSKEASKQLTKLGEVKRQLIPVIKGLPEDSFFSIITFENDIKTWKSTLVQANSTNKTVAVALIQDLESGGGTNIFDALEEAFKMAGKGAKDNNVLPEVDEIFLLTDGQPSAGKYTSPNDIIAKVSDMNLLKRVKVNAIGLGQDKDPKFLEELARKNNGTYIDK